MNIKQIKALASQGESQTVEFKKSTANLHAAFETICAFLNGIGGTVVIGVTDKGKIVGQEVADSTRKALAYEISKLEPSAHLEIKYIAVDASKQVIVIQVKKGVYAPYIYDGRAFQRHQSTTTRMSQHRYEQLIVLRGQLNHSWELGVAENCSIDDLDHDEIRRAVKQGIQAGRIPETVENETIVNILKSWKLVKGSKINNAAIVLFVKEVLPYYPQCHIKLARFRGIDKQSGFIDNKDFYGNAFRIFNEANNFIMRYLPIASFFESDRLERIDKPTLPVLAVREALVNAICHRDYSNRSSTITLAIFDDRMEIWNKGKLPADLKIDDLKKKHQSEPRNENIAKVFYDRKYFDGWGTGIIRIFDLCNENAIPEPEYEQYSGGTEIIFKFKDSIAVTYVEKGAIKQNLSSRQEAILALIKEHGDIGIQKIMSELMEPPSQRMVKKDLNYLKEIGLVALKGNARTAVWTLK